jgi:Sec-independent protein secretion pathway component TatC
MLMLAIPMYLLYELGVLAVRLFVPRRVDDTDAAAGT